MAEEKNPIESAEKEVREINEQSQRPYDYPPGQANELEQRLEEDPKDPTGFDVDVERAIEASERATDTPLVEGFDAGVTGIQEAIESLGGAPTHPVEAMAHVDEGDTTTVAVLGRTYVLPVPIYTAVFGALGVLTLLEVILAEVFTADWLRIPLLLGIAIVKALLVVIFYMHLRTDSRVFALTLLLPMLVALLSMLYLLGVPPTGY
jgi:cytochrome c oxidase subunit IV